MKISGKLIFKNFLCIARCFIMISGSVFAAKNTSYADTLFAIGLFLGTDNGYELDKTLTREEATTILVRLLGEAENVSTDDFTEVFEDVSESRWSFPYVMYCYENDITKGTGTKTFSPADDVSAEQFLTLVLRLLGYTEAAPETAFTESVYKGIFNSDKAKEIEQKTKFLRDDMVYIVYRSLMCKMSNGMFLADFLAEKGVITTEQAININPYKNTNNIDDLINSLLG